MKSTKRDWTKLEKGSQVSQAECESILECTKEEAIYSVRMLALVTEVQRSLVEAGKQCHVCVRDAGLYILTDEETPDYALSSFERARRTINRAHFVNQGADRLQMTSDAQRKHDRALAVGAAYSQAIARERRKLAVEESI